MRADEHDEAGADERDGAAWGSVRDPRLEIPEVLRRPVAGRAERDAPTAGAMPAAWAQNPALRFSAVGLEVVLYVAVGGGVGWLLDRWLGTGPWLLMSLLLLGVVGGSYRFVREGLAANRRVASEAADRRRAGQTPGGS